MLPCVLIFSDNMLYIEDFRRLNHPETIAITRHGKNRLIERGISVDDVVDTIDSGEIIKQYEDDTPLPSCLILGNSASEKPIHVVLSHDEDFIYLITAYHPDPELWNDDFRTRRK